MEIKTLKISQIDTNKGQVEGLPKNPRFIRDENFARLMKSIADAPEMLSLRELIVYPVGRRFVCIAGNMRLRACRELGMQDVPCKVLAKDTPVEKLREYAIKDNNPFGEDDWDVLANEWDTAELEDWGLTLPTDWGAGLEPEGEEEAAEDDNFDPAEASTKQAITKMGDIWKLGDHRLICGDSTQAETIDRLMGDEVADCIITDPPYNVDYHSSDGKKIDNDKMAEGAFAAFLLAAFSAANRHLKQGGAFYIWHSDLHGLTFRTACIEAGWEVRQVLVWNKNALVLGRQDYQWKHEPCLYGWKEGAGHYFAPRRDLTTVIDCPKPLRSAEHPTMKPIPLIALQMRNSTRRREVVLDMFGGSGTTMMAAEQLGRRCYMVEYAPKYCDVIVKRWEELTGRQAERQPRKQ